MTLEREQRLAEPADGLGDDEVDVGVERPADLLLERAAHQGVGCRVVRLVDVGVGEVAGEQRAALVRHLLGDRQRLTVERLQDVLLADHLQLLAMAVVGERLDHVRAGVHELPVQLAHHLGMVEHDLGHVRRRPAGSRAAPARTDSPRRRSPAPPRAAPADPPLASSFAIAAPPGPCISHDTGRAARAGQWRKATLACRIRPSSGGSAGWTMAGSGDVSPRQAAGCDTPRPGARSP